MLNPQNASVTDSNIAINNSVFNDIRGDQNNYYIDHGKANKLCDPPTEPSILHVGRPDERLTIGAWISPLNFKATQLDVFQKRAPNTGQWLLESLEFNSWLVGVSETLWCPGIREMLSPTR
jgi:hypothetical protein